jgi:branched-chain amino acid transport system ATP-binding protein
MTEPLLQIEDVWASYGAVRALRGVSLQVAAGKATAVLGPNGAGKTSLLRTISGQLKPSAGRIALDGQATPSSAAWRVARAGIAHVPEGRHVFGKLTIEQNLRLGAYRRRDADIDRDVAAMFDRFPILGERRNQRAGLLSGGEQQMLVIARGVIARPRLMMLDEPSMGLAPRIVKDVFALLGELRDEGLSLLIVEQNAVAALSVAEYGYVLSRGEVVAEGTATELSAGESDLHAAYLGASS